MDKEKIRQYLAINGLASRMNLTKWKELLEIINQLPFPPAFVCKYMLTDEDKNYLESLDKLTVNYLGDWSLNSEPTGLPNLDFFYQIEYIKIKPKLAKYRGKYIEDEVTDISDTLLKKLYDKNIPFEIDNFDNIVICGYR